jgi:hypothetical protein
VRCHCLIRPEPFYRREAFVTGLKAAGHEVVDGPPRNPDADTLLVIWNRYGPTHDLASRVEAAGGVVICTENGYLGRGGSVPKWDVHPNGPKPDDYYALSLGGHNGSGSWSEGDGSRWESLGIPLMPLRRQGEHILICSSRPFGRPGLIQPDNWPDVTARRLRALTGREVRVRAHPGNDAPQRPLSADLEGAWAVVIWASSAGVHALVSGVPVLCEAPKWICKSASLPSWRALEVLEDSQHERDTWERLRLKALERMAWGQWTCAEVESGLPFDHLLRRANEEKVALSA